MKVWLNINAAKSQAIKLVDDSIRLSYGSEIFGVKQNERIEYILVAASTLNKLVFDDSFIVKLNKNVDMISILCCPQRGSDASSEHDTRDCTNSLNADSETSPKIRNIRVSEWHF